MTNNTEKDVTVIARLAGAFGIKGEMRVVFMHDVLPQDLIEHKQILTVEKTGQTLTPTHARSLNEGVAMRFAEIPDRNVAETYIKSGLTVPSEFLKNLMPLAENEFFLEDLEGCHIFIENQDTAIGHIAHIYNFGAGDILDITLLNEKNYMVPLLDDLVIDVILEEQKVIVTPAIQDYLTD